MRMTDLLRLPIRHAIPSNLAKSLLTSHYFSCVRNELNRLIDAVDVLEDRDCTNFSLIVSLFRFSIFESFIFLRALSPDLISLTFLMVRGTVINRDVRGATFSSPFDGSRSPI